MKAMVLATIMLVAGGFAFQPATASAVSTRQWIQLGLNVAGGAQTLAKLNRNARLGKVGLNPQPLPPRLFLRRF